MLCTINDVTGNRLPFDTVQVTPVVELVVKVTLDPWQNVVGPLALIIGAAGVGFTVIVIGFDVFEQPLLVTWTLYVPELVMGIDWLIWLLFHKFPDEAEDVNTTEFPEQNVVGPFAEIIGWGGVLFTVTVMLLDCGEVQPFSVTVA